MVSYFVHTKYHKHCHSKAKATWGQPILCFLNSYNARPELCFVTQGQSKEQHGQEPDHIRV